ncbi:MAG: helix-turn-helix domain-containing protein, partial [Alistipes sp.]
TTKSIKEIAEELHFSDQSFFGKYFLLHTGVRPSEYRK